MILFYAAENNPVVEALEQIVAGEIPTRPLIRCRSLNVLEQRLRRPRNDIDVILISVNDAIEMRQLNAMRALLIDLRLVMVLPWRDEDIIAWAHKLGPRFIAFADNGYEQVGPVLRKMFGAAKVIHLCLHR
ncbi:MAG: hypothetical protein M0036_11655 [Desulfobacteraceae bacterium]|nr:hypothetical protein [Desulfobacteraceae bacterium]